MGGGERGFVFGDALFGVRRGRLRGRFFRRVAEKNLRATQAEVEERLRAARATWEARERDLRRRVRQLESAAEAFDFASGADKEGKTSRESLRILAEQAEKALRQREAELAESVARRRSRRGGTKPRLWLRWSARLPRRAAPRRRRRRTPCVWRGREAEAAVWAQLETTLREQIAAYERKKKRKSLEDPNEPNDRDGSTNESTSGDDDRVAWMRGETGLSPTESEELASLRAEVERLAAALGGSGRTRSTPPRRRPRRDDEETVRVSNPCLEPPEPSNPRVSNPPSPSPDPSPDPDPVAVPASRVAVVERAMFAARNEAASLRARLEAKEAELADRATRGRRWPPPRRSARARADLSAELRVASRGYDEELARVGAELASLQASLAARETSVERMQSRMDAEARSETSAQMEISDARSELSKMQAALEKMASDVARKKDVESKLAETRETLRAMETRAEGAEARVAELETERRALASRVEEKRRALEAARAELEEASRLVGVSPREIWRPSPISRTQRRRTTTPATPRPSSRPWRLAWKRASRADATTRALPLPRGAAALAAKVSAEVQARGVPRGGRPRRYAARARTLGREVSARAGSEAASARGPRHRRRRWRRGSLTWRKSSR